MGWEGVKSGCHGDGAKVLQGPLWLVENTRHTYYIARRWTTKGDGLSEHSRGAGFQQCVRLFSRGFSQPVLRLEDVWKSCTNPCVMPLHLSKCNRIHADYLCRWEQLKSRCTSQLHCVEHWQCRKKWSCVDLETESVNKSWKSELNFLFLLIVQLCLKFYTTLTWTQIRQRKTKSTILHFLNYADSFGFVCPGFKILPLKCLLPPRYNYACDASHFKIFETITFSV